MIHERFLLWSKINGSKPWSNNYVPWEAIFITPVHSKAGGGGSGQKKKEAGNLPAKSGPKRMDSFRVRGRPGNLEIVRHGNTRSKDTYTHTLSPMGADKQDVGDHPFRKSDKSSDRNGPKLSTGFPEIPHIGDT